MSNGNGILMNRPKVGTTVEVWLVCNRGQWVGMVPALAGVGAKGPDPEAIYSYCRSRTMDIVMRSRNNRVEPPWQAITRKPPIGCTVRRFTYKHGGLNGL